jgi:acyl carrier protein
MITESEIETTLSGYLHSELNPRQATLTPDTNLIEAGLLDSLSIFKLVVFMEQRFAIKIEAEDILVEHFETIRTLNILVRSKQR